MFTALYPGQGSQSPGMGQFLFNEFSEARLAYEEASDAISFDLKKLCFTGSESELQQTENTQPALLVTSIATHLVLTKKIGVQFKCASGHSIGEYAALVGAGVLSLSDATRAVRERGRAMQSAVPLGEGSMMATLGLDEEQAQFLCRWAEKESGYGPLSPANFNSPGQIVISGSAKVLNWLKENFKPEILPGAPKKVKLIPLSVSAPFHCAMMEPAEKKMRDVLSQILFNKAQYPIIQNYTADCAFEAHLLKENLIRQISAPVLWTQCMHKAKSMGLTQFIECGHGSVLKGLLKKIDADFQVWSTSSLEDLKKIESDLKAMGH